MDKTYFTYSPHEEGRPIVLDGKAVAYVEEGVDEMTGYILASSQDVREKLEDLAYYLQTSLRLKGCRKAEKLAEEAFSLLSRSMALLEEDEMPFGVIPFESKAKTTVANETEGAS